MSIHKKFWADSTLLCRSQAHGEPLQAQSDPRGRRPHGLRAFIHMSMKNYILTHPLFLSPTPKWYISQVVPPRPWDGGVCAQTPFPVGPESQGLGLWVTEGQAKVASPAGSSPIPSVSASRAA